MAHLLGFSVCVLCCENILQTLCLPIHLGRGTHNQGWPCTLRLQVGKSLLIRCLIRHYTRQSLSEVRGPITVVSGKARRLTFVECPQASHLGRSLLRVHAVPRLATCGCPCPC